MLALYTKPHSGQHELYSEYMDELQHHVVKIDVTIGVFFYVKFVSVRR